MRIRIFAAVALGALTVTGCATKGQLREGLREQRALLEAERAERMRADSMYAAELGAVRADVATLRNDLQMLRTEFGAKITAMENGVKVTFPVNFAFDDASVRPEDEPALQRFADVAQKHFQGAVITVEGFADPAGSRAYNIALSKRRAETVRARLLASGLTEEQIRAVGYGESRLVVPNASHDDSGAELNRRVVFVIESKGQNVGIASTSGGK